jgi:hypothetical protein
VQLKSNITNQFSRRMSAGRKSFLPAILLLAAFGTTAAHADSATYTYTGLDFTVTDGGPISDSDYITATITLSTALPANQPLTNDEGELTSWTISDQYSTYYSTDPDVLPNDTQLFLETTDSVITDWEFSISELGEIILRTINAAPNVFDETSNLNDGYGAYNTGTPGSWATVSSVPPSTPEPSTCVLVFSGVILVIAIRRYSAGATQRSDCKP